MNQQDASLDWTVIDEPPLPGAIGPVLEIDGHAVGVPLLAWGGDALRQQAATTPIPVDAGTYDIPVRPAREYLKGEPHPTYPILWRGKRGMQHRQIVDGGVLLIQMCVVHAPKPAKCRYRHSDGNNNLPVHDLCLLLSQGDAGRLPQTAVPHI